MKPQSLRSLKLLAKKEGWLKYVVTENDEAALLNGCRVDLRRGNHVCEFFEKYLCHSQGEWAGQPFRLMAWQKEMLIPLFGWIKPDGMRRFKRASIWVSKKNGKSSLASGLALYMLAGDGEPGAKVFCVANDREQASLVWSECASMVDQSPELSKHLKVLRGSIGRRIMLGHNAFVAPISSDNKVSEGKNAHGVIIDEVHVFDERGRTLRESLRYAGTARRQPLEIIISTAGDELAGCGRDEYEYADGVRRGKSAGGIEDQATFVRIFEATNDDDWTSPQVWRKANPSLGVIFQEEIMSEECEAAKQSPRLENVFKRYRLNIWTSSEHTALPTVKWAACGNANMTAESLIGRPCWAGIDLSSTTDLTALALCFPEPESDDNESGRYSFLVWFWLPRENIVDREREDRMRYRHIAETDGRLVLTPGASVSYDMVYTKCKDLFAIYNPSEVAFDPWNARKFASDMQADAGITMVEVPQTTMYLNSASKLFESLVLDGKLAHQNDPILNKMAADLCWWVDSQGNIRPMKSDSKKRRRRIDGIAASIMALSRAMVGQGTESIYERQEMMVL